MVTRMYSTFYTFGVAGWVVCECFFLGGGAGKVKILGASGFVSSLLVLASSSVAFFAGKYRLFVLILFVRSLKITNDSWEVVEFCLPKCV